MDSDDATLCLDDIRSVRLVVNEILKTIRKTGGAGGGPTASSSSSSPSSGIQTIPTDPGSLQSLKLQISELDTKMERTSAEIRSICIPLTTNGSMMSAHSLEQEDPHHLNGLFSWSGLSDVSWTLLLSFLGVWLSVVLLTLIWMRLTDLRYKPRVVNIFKRFAINVFRF